MLTVLVLAAALQTPAITGAAVTAPASILSRRDAKEYAEAWTSITNAIRNGYYARRTRKTEMEKLLTKYEPLAKDSKDDADFEGHVEDMIHEFDDSHFDFFTKADPGYYLMDGLRRGNNAATMPMVGAWFKSTPQGYTVQMVLENSDAAKAGLRAGDLVLDADGSPFAPILSFVGKEGMAVKLDVKRKDERIAVTVKPEDERPLEAFLRATRDSARLIRAGNKSIGYVHLWTQANDDFRSTLAGLVTGRFADTDGFILDLRDGFGGRPEGFADPFFRPAFDIKWDYVGMQQTEHFGYSKPLVVLINGGSRSAKEMLSYILKNSHRATLVGTRTAGNVLGTGPRPIRNWAYLEMPMVDVAIDGRRLEKNGVEPNVKVEDGLDSDGADRVIERAVSILSRR